MQMQNLNPNALIIIAVFFANTLFSTIKEGNMLNFIIGFFIGGFAGILTMALFTANNDRRD